MPWAAIMATAKAFAATAAGKAVISGATSAAATRLLRPKISKPRIDFKQMRDDAQAAGFNPLTAMRSGAISGYMIPALSKQSFVGQFLSGAIRAGTDAFLNKDIDAYNAEVRKLDILERIQNINYTGKLSKSLGLDNQPKSVPLMRQDGKPLKDKYGKQIYVPAETQEVIPKYKVVWDQANGSTYAVINPELTESGLSEYLTGIITDTAFQAAAQKGLGASFKLGGKEYGFPRDPLGFNFGIRFPNADNTQYAKPKLSFGQ